MRVLGKISMPYRCAWHKMRPIVTDVARSLSLSVCPAETDESIEMMFGKWTLVDARNRMYFMTFLTWAQIHNEIGALLAGRTWTCPGLPAVNILIVIRMGR